MELPNYSRQLMQQLQTLRTEAQFCDCTILVGSEAHPAHKVVLAASSLLFKSLLETSDSISIDTSVVTAQEFSSLLDMAYLGRLLPGKHDFTRVITAADSLQMFDVAVGCKNVLDELVKQSERAQGLKDHTDAPLCERQLDASGAEFVAQGCPVRSPGNKILESQNDGAVELLSHKRDALIRSLQDIQPWINILRTWDSLTSQQQRMLLECFEGDPGVEEVFQRLLDQVKDGRDVPVQAVVLLLDQINSLKSDLGSVQVEERGQTGPDLTGGSVSEVAKSSGYQRELTSDLTDYLRDVENVPELLARTADRCKSEDIKQVLLECSRAENHGKVLRKLLSSLAEREIPETSVLLLLKEAGDSSANAAGILSECNDKRMPDQMGVSLLRAFQNRLCELKLETRIIRQSLEEGPGISSDQREVLQKEADGGVGKMLRAALGGGSVQPLTVWRLLFWAATHNPELRLVMQEVRAKPEAQELVHTVARVDALFKHRKLILETINEIPDLERAAGDLDHDKGVTEFLLRCRGSDGGTESVQQVLDRVLSRESQHVRPLCHLLSASRENFPQLSVLIQELRRVEVEHEEESVASEQEAEVEEKDENGTHRRRKGVVVSYSCQWCSKTFDFKCRMLKHKKQCAFCPERVQRCSECSAVFPSFTALQLHRSEAHNCPPVKRKKVEPVACELCGRTFKNPSGLLYHRRTEHLEERPYACEECGAKFAANSSLKNHMRLHTGEKPYRCKHCDMSFAVAAALSYHTKKKHSEGKMYSCQYCSATFAQSIELTRHVRTHTGDKPYVCRECGKGFKQANGLSVHLQTFHNISDPHDCQKCRVSFSCVEKLRDHIQEVHPKELHQCPECSKILNTAAQLEKHMSIHDGSKPYSCQSCHKSYQTLSGLWYHKRTAHPDTVTTEGGRSVSHLLHCKICNKAFCNRSSLFKHNIIKHPETHAETKEGEKEAQADAAAWRCAYCPRALSSEQELQQHMSGEHVSQQGSVFACAVCSLSFLSEAEFQQHFLANHVQLVQEEELQSHGSTSQMVIHTDGVSAEGVEQIIGLDQSHLAGSQQVFVALGDSGEAAAESGIVAVNVDDLLMGRVTLICEENQ